MDHDVMTTGGNGRDTTYDENPEDDAHEDGDPGHSLKGKQAGNATADMSRDKGGRFKPRGIEGTPAVKNGRQNNKAGKGQPHQKR